MVLIDLLHDKQCMDPSELAHPPLPALTPLPMLIPAELDKMKELQRQTGSAYIPLTGRLKPSSTTAAFADEPSGLTSARTATAATPMLGGGLTPLSGNKKVEMMLGISKGGSSNGAGSMPPPAPRR